MRFDEGLALFLSTIIGAGIFALPILAHEVSPLYVVASISIAFLFSIFLGYTILDLAPSDVEEEIGRIFGDKAKLLLHIANITIILLSLVAYTLALEMHLQTSMFVIALLLFIPLFFNVTFPAAFSTVFAFFILLFLGFVSLGNLSFVRTVTQKTAGLFLAPLVAAAYFAFFGHNIIPRIRNIVRNLAHVREIVLFGTFIVFLVYLPFVLSTAYLGVDEISTLVLSKVYSEPISSIISLIAAIIFYTSFVLLGIHLQDMLPARKYSSLLIVLIVTILYYFVKVFSIPFVLLIATAGFVVSIYGAIVSVAAIKTSSKKDFFSQISPIITLLLSFLPWVLLLISLL